MLHILSYLAAEWNPPSPHFFGNKSQKNLQKKLDPGIEMCLAPGQGGAVMRLILICARRAPQHVQLGIF